MTTPEDALPSPAPTGIPSERGLVLIGATGSGTDLVGEHVAQQLGRHFASIATEVVRQLGTPAADAFVDIGERAYRDAERVGALKLIAAAAQGAVVDLGGGACLAPEVALALRQAQERRRGPVVVWLRITAPNAMSRLGLNGPRPAALGPVRAQFMALMKESDSVFDMLATTAVDVDYRHIDDVVADVLAALTTAEGTAP